MKKVLLLIFCYTCTYYITFAQTDKVEVTKDPKIDSLIARRIELNKNGRSAGQINGFRVQIYSGADRKKAYAELARFRSLYQEFWAYLSYSQPDYKVRVGDFRTRLDAEKFSYRIKQNFPYVFIFPDQVTPK